MEKRHRTATSSRRSVFNVLDPITNDGLAIELDGNDRLVARAIHPNGERVVIVSERGAARRLATALLAALDDNAAERPRMVAL
jgi:hypothetical protein